MRDYLFPSSPWLKSAITNIPLLAKAVASNLPIFPSLVKEGWPRHLKNASVPLMGADGVVGSTSRSHLIDIRVAHRFDKVRFAEIYKEASRHSNHPVCARLRRLRGLLLKGAATPPYQ